MPQGYGTDEGFEAYAEAMGYTLPAGDVTTARARGSAYIDAMYGARFPGTPVDGIEQERAWPREDAADIYGNEISASAIPTRVVHASYEAAFLELTTPGSLAVIIATNEKIRRLKAGSVEIEYADSSGNVIEGAAPMSTAIEGLLYPLLGTAEADLPFPAILVV